jgi:hypothetical protein
MKQTRRRFLSEESIYRDLTVFLGLFLILSPVLDHLTDNSKIDAYLTVALLIFALYVITRRTSDLVIGLVLGVPAVAGGLFDAATPDSPTMNAVPLTLMTLFFGFLVWRILKDVFTGSRFTSEQIYGAVCAYLLIGFLFASVYGFVALADPEAFAYSDALEIEIAAQNEQRSSGILTYFSFVTMSTLGFGDISPVSSTARTLAWIQAVLGQLYLAITIAALVGTHIAQRRN